MPAHKYSLGTGDDIYPPIHRSHCGGGGDDRLFGLVCRRSRWPGPGSISLAIVLATADWAYLRHARLEVTRICDEKLSLGAQNPIRLALRNPGYVQIRGIIRDEYPERLRCPRKRRAPRSAAQVGAGDHILRDSAEPRGP